MLLTRWQQYSRDGDNSKSVAVQRRNSANMASWRGLLQGCDQAGAGVTSILAAKHFVACTAGCEQQHPAPLGCGCHMLSRPATSPDLPLALALQADSVVCHFFHKEFERCKIVDKHLGQLCRKFFETRFIKVSAPVSGLCAKGG